MTSSCDHDFSSVSDTRPRRTYHVLQMQSTNDYWLTGNLQNKTGYSKRYDNKHWRIHHHVDSYAMWISFFLTNRSVVSTPKLANIWRIFQVHLTNVLSMKLFPPHKHDVGYGKCYHTICRLAVVAIFSSGSCRRVSDLDMYCAVNHVPDTCRLFHSFLAQP